MRRYTGNMNGEQYLANTSPSKREVHDLDAEKANCQIDEIMRLDHDRAYTSLLTAQFDRYINCTYCLSDSKW